MDRVDPAASVARVGVRFTAAAVAPLLIALLGLFPPLGLTSAAGPWLAPLGAGLAAAALGVAMAATLASGLRRGAPGDLLRAIAVGSLAAGLGVASIRSATVGPEVPDAGLPLVAVVSAAFLLLARLSPLDGVEGRALRGGAAIAVFVLVEVALGAALLLGIPAGAAPLLFAAAALVAAAASLPGPSLPPVLLAGAFAGLAIARPGTLEAVLPLVPLALAGIGFAWPAAVEMPPAKAEPGPAVPSEVPTASLTEMAIDDDATRLARELRGTIEELLQARRTIELQRVEIGRAAAIDPLTGVATRRSILDRLTIEAAEARRYTHPVAVVLVDVDGFTRLNHDHGLAVGDAVLQELALRMRLRIRAADALGRLGGDSFLAILPHTDERGAAVFADALRRRLIGRPVETEVGELVIAVSIGVAFIRPGMELSDEELLAAADEALASARAAGGNRIAFDRLHGLARIDERRIQPTDEPAGRAG